MKTIQAVSYLVEDYDEAIDWFKSKLDFVVLVDQPIEQGKRFIRMAPCVSNSFSLVLVLAEPQQLPKPGEQSNGVFLFLQTDEFERDYQKMLNNGVRFTESPRNEIYAKVVVFEDLYGNHWDLIQPIN